MSPALQALPVVTTKDEDKLVIGIVGLQVLQSGPRIRRLRERELIILRYKTWFVSQCLLYKMVSLLSIREGSANLERVLRTDHKPHFIETLVFKHPFADGNMSVMDGVKGTSKKSYSHTINKRVIR
jgi:hypothetical protein